MSGSAGNWISVSLTSSLRASWLASILVTTLMQLLTILVLASKSGIVILKSLLIVVATSLSEPRSSCFESTVRLKITLSISEQEALGSLRDVATTINRLLRITIPDFEARTKIVNNCINVVTNMEANQEALRELVKETDIQLPAEPDIMAEEGMIVNTAQSFVDFLEQKMSHTDANSTLKEDITPVLAVLYNFARTLRPVRKYLKSTILPPLQKRDIKVRPDEGNSLKSRLVSLLTNTTGDISTMVAELLFILCKENVGKLVKHTGYGNAAGLLARRGLMAGGRRGGGQQDYSEDEESDTEEYRAERHKVNPVTGCEEKVVASPFEGMSEEQKEYEAMKLVNTLDKMTRSGVIQPCRVGEDGRPEAVESVLQLQEGLQQPPKSEDEDSD